MSGHPPTPAQRRVLWLALTGLAVATILALVWARMILPAWKTAT